MSATLETPGSGRGLGWLWLAVILLVLDGGSSILATVQQLNLLQAGQAAGDLITMGNGSNDLKELTNQFRLVLGIGAALTAAFAAVCCYTSYLFVNRMERTIVAFQVMCVFQVVLRISDLYVGWGANSVLILNVLLGAPAFNAGWLVLWIVVHIAAALFIRNSLHARSYFDQKRTRKPGSMVLPPIEGYASTNAPSAEKRSVRTATSVERPGSQHDRNVLQFRARQETNGDSNVPRYVAFIVMALLFGLVGYFGSSSIRAVPDKASEFLNWRAKKQLERKREDNILLMKRILERVAASGLSGEHHYFITFRTNESGVILPARVKREHPEELTVVMQYRFENLRVDQMGFSVDLWFSGTRERIAVPFSAVTEFYDPAPNGVYLK